MNVNTNISVDIHNESHTESDVIADFILIDVNVFQKFRETHVNPIEHIQEKADLLKKTFNCFQEIYDSRTLIVGSKNSEHNHSVLLKNGNGSGETGGKWGKTKFSGVQSQYNRNVQIQSNVKPDKLRIGTCGRELSKEDRMKRDFMSFVNRLSDGNRKNIPTYFKTNLQVEFIDTYIRLIWEAMLRTEDFQHLYIECLQEICMIVYDNNRVDFMIKINDITSKYITDTQWIPSIELINEETYDDFCDFVKWKKTSITYIRGFAKFINKDWLYVSLYNDLSKNFIDSIHKYLSEIPEGCKVTDALLEQLLVLLEYTKGDQDKETIHYINDLHENAELYRPSTRFKIYDIHEFLERKIKYIVPGRKN
jgi:hypothetical protein